MLKVAWIQTRKKDTSPFFKKEIKPEHLVNIKKKYIDTGKLLRQEVKLSDDKLIVQNIQYWKHIDDYLNFVMDQECHDVDLSDKVLDKLKELDVSLTTKLEFIHD